MEKEALTLEDQMVQEEFNLLLDDYIHSNHRQKTERITEAFLFAKMAHSMSPKRSSGEPYIMHPLAVARIVCKEMGLGSTSICAALLHDVVEDTGYKVEDIQESFGEKIAEIVDGLTKITFHEKNTEQWLNVKKDTERKEDVKEHSEQAGEQDLAHFSNLSMQAASIRKLLVTMGNDIRVILVKIADRLHNLRTLASMKQTSQFRTIGETMFLYAPLANRLGLHVIKTELEDLCFMYEHPKEYERIRKKLKTREQTQLDLFKNFAKPVDEKLQAMGLTYEMHHRVKSAYSIWEKMEAKNIAFEDVFDIFAVRIIFESREDMEDIAVCWQIYAAITHHYHSHPDRLRDWVSHPKTNGYQSLHLTVMGPDGEWIEIQVRSRKMDEVAQKGVAAHWKYKEHDTEEETELNKWLHTISEILEHPAPNTLDFLDTIKMNLFASEIYVFTPKGVMVTLPKNATVLDFAYELHGNLGNNCIGAKVNRRLVPLSHPLTNGDQVEVLTARSQQLQPEWLGFVVTAKARTKIEAVLKRERKELSKKGEPLLIEAFQKAGIEPISSYIDKVAVYYGFPKREDLYYALAKGSVAPPDNIKGILANKTDNILFRYVKDIFHVSPKNKGSQKPSADGFNGEINRNEPYQLMGNEFGQNYEVAPCCKPIQGDEVLGFINEDNTVIVHKRSCLVAVRLKTSFKDRILSTLWCGHTNFTFEATLGIKGIDNIGVLQKIATTISEDFNVNIKQVLIETNDGVFEGKIKMLVHSVDDVRKMCVALSKIESIRSVVRIVD